MIIEGWSQIGLKLKFFIFIFSLLVFAYFENIFALIRGLYPYSIPLEYLVVEGYSPLQSPYYSVYTILRLSVSLVLVPMLLIYVLNPSCFRLLGGGWPLVNKEIVVAFVCVLAVAYLNRDGKERSILVELSNNKMLLYFVFLVVIVAPITEEFFYRGYALAILTEMGCNVILSSVIVSIVWTLQHRLVDIQDFFSALFFGILLGVVRYRSNSLFFPVIFHAMYNLILLF